MAERALAPVDTRERLLRNLIMKDATADQIDLALNVCKRYGFDPLLKHIVFISGALYVTRDGLIHLAHASGQFDGIEVNAERDDSGKWTAIARVYRRDMTRPFTYSAYQPEHENTRSIAWQKAPRAMTIKCAEVMALRRAFDVSLGGAEEVGLDESDLPSTDLVNVTERNEPVTKADDNALMTQPAVRALIAHAKDHGVGVEALSAHATAVYGVERLADLTAVQGREVWRQVKAIRPVEEKPPSSDESGELPFSPEEYAAMAQLGNEQVAEEARR